MSYAVGTKHVSNMLGEGRLSKVNQKVGIAVTAVREGYAKEEVYITH